MKCLPDHTGRHKLSGRLRAPGTTDPTNPPNRARSGTRDLAHPLAAEPVARAERPPASSLLGSRLEQDEGHPGQQDRKGTPTSGMEIRGCVRPERNLSFSEFGPGPDELGQPQDIK